MVDHVLVPVDASQKAERAFDWVVDEFSDVEVTVFHVLHPKDTSHEEGDVVDQAQVLMGRASDVLDLYETDRDDLSLEKKVGVDRKESRAIVEYASESGCDLVALGSHGREGVSRVLLGSVAEKAVRRSPTPVLVVR